MDIEAGRHAPRSSQQPLPLLDLPANVQATIVQEAGLHARQVCRAFRDLHPPLLALAPHGLPTPEALAAALAALPPTLTSLNLESVEEPYGTPFNETHLATICTNLPHLQRLTLPCELDTSDQAGPLLLDESIALLPHLHTLHAHPTVHFLPNTWARLQQPLIATRLRSLSLPAESMDDLLEAPPATFPHLTSLRLHNPGAGFCDARPRSAADFAALSAVAPALQSLEVDDYIELVDDAPLATVKVTALKLGGHCYTDHPTAPLLQHIGTLTALRSLSVTLEHRGFTPAEAGWLSRLTQLTRLAVVLIVDDGDEDQDWPPPLQVAPWAQGEADEPVPLFALALAFVARDAAQLPLLQDLELGGLDVGLGVEDPELGVQVLKLGMHCWAAVNHLGHGTPHSVLHYVPTATQLRRLCLADLPLAPGQGQQLSNLQHLTCLHLNARAPQPIAPSNTGQGQPGGGAIGLGWISTLQALQQLQVYSPLAAAQCGPLQDALAGLTGLHTLSLLHLPPGHDLAAVLRHFEHTLVRLDLSDMHACYLPVLPVLRAMTRLQVLDLATAQHKPGALAPHLRLPGSLRRCYLHPMFNSGKHYCRYVHLVPGQRMVVVGWRRQYPLVDFCLYDRPDKHLW